MAIDFRRAVLAIVAIVVMACGTAAAADTMGEFSVAQIEAELGGFVNQCGLRAMLWTEQLEVASFLLVRPTPAEEGHLKEAETRAKALLSAVPDHLASLVLLGKLAWIGGRATEANDFYQRALAFNPDFGPALLGMADLYLDRRDADRARATLSRIKTSEASLGNEVALRLGTLALWRGDGQEAVGALTACTPPGGDGDLPFLWVLAKGYAQAGAATYAAAICGAEVPIWARGLWAEQSGLLAPAVDREDGGLAELSLASAAAPAYPCPTWERALAQLERNDTAGALGLLTNGRTAPAGLVGGSLFLLGTAREEAKDTSGAVRAFSELIGKRPQLGLAYYGLGRAYFLMQRNTEALRYLGTGIKISPKLPCLYLQRAEVYDRLKMRTTASKDRGTAGAIRPSSSSGSWRLNVQAVSGAKAVTALVSVTGGTTSLRGLFLSRDGRRWRWYPWHMTPVAFPGVAAGQTIYALPDLGGTGDVLLAASVPTPAPRDTRAPAFVRPCVVTGGQDGSSIVWQTDEPTKAQVTIWARGGNEDAGMKLKENTYSLWHRISLGDLFPREYYLRVTIADAVGNAANSEPVFFHLEQPAYSLTGAFAINGGAAYTNQRRVNLSLSLNGDERTALVRIGNEDGFFSNWSPLTQVTSWELSPGDGIKAVAVQFRQGSALSPVYTREVTLDTKPPAIYGFLVPSVTETSASLSWQTDEPAVARVDLRQNDQTWATVSWSTEYTQAHRAQLTSLQPGMPYTLRIMATDRAGNTGEITPANLVTVKAPDRTPPTGWVQIGDGGPFANTIYVNLTIEASDADSGVREMSFSNDGFIWSMPEAFARAKQWRLAPGDGPKAVFMKLTDLAGNTSPVITARITLDTTAPSLYVASPLRQLDGRLYFSWRTDELSRGLVQLGTTATFSSPDARDLRELELDRDHSVTLPAPPGVSVVYYRVVAIDQAGNLASSPVGTLSLPMPDREGPTGGIRINNGGSTTADPRVTLSIWANDPSGVASMRLRNADSFWGSWETYATTRYWTLSSGEGDKEVQIMFRDTHGNESQVYQARIRLDAGTPAPRDVTWTQTGARTVSVRWRTDEPTNGIIYYHRSSGGTEYRQSEGREANPGYDHEVTLINLEPGVSYRAKVVVSDRYGNQAECPEFTITVAGVDQTRPYGQITVNNGAAYTKTTQVTLALSANDPGGAVVSMSFSTDGRNWSPDESYQTTRAYTLPAGDGTKTVYARFRDRAGLYSDPASDSIILDTRPPSISNVAVNQMGPDTVEISWRTDEPAFGAVRYGAAIRSYNERGAEDRSGLPQQDGGYGTEHRVRLTRLYPGRTYYASIEAIDRAENRSESPEFQFTASAPDQTKPTGTIRINNGAAYTKTTQVTLALSANDPGGAVVSMSFSTDGRNWSPDESYQTTRAYTLPAGDGTKTVYARFRDRAGLYSDPASDSIILDTRPPSISNVAVNQMGPDTVEISWRTDEPAFGAVRYGAAIRSYNERGAEDRSGLPQQDGGYGTEHRVRLTRLYPGRTYYASIEAIDRAENRSESPEFHFTASAPDQTKPTGTIRINNGAAYTKTTQVTLALSANDPGGAVVSMSFSTDGRNWSPDESYQTTRAYTLPAGDGTKTVYARFRDRAGLYSDPASDSIILDTRPPSISNVAVNQMGPDTVEISWRTDEPAFGAVRYGAAIRSYNERGAEDRSGLPQQDGGYGTEHRVRLTRLYPAGLTTRRSRRSTGRRTVASRRSSNLRRARPTRPSRRERSGLITARPIQKRPR